MNCQATIYSGNGCDCDRCQDGKLPEASPVWEEREEREEREEGGAITNLTTPHP